MKEGAAQCTHETLTAVLRTGEGTGSRVMYRYSSAVSTNAFENHFIHACPGYTRYQKQQQDGNDFFVFKRYRTLYSSLEKELKKMKINEEQKGEKRRKKK